MSSPSATFDVVREPGSDLYLTTAEGTSFTTANRILRAPREGIREILLGELARGGNHPLYGRAIKALQPLWEEA